MILRSLEGVDGICGRGLAGVFDGGIRQGADDLERFLHTLGVSTDPASYGVSTEEWAGLLATALEGDRGQNFIGSRAALGAAMQVPAGKPSAVLAGSGSSQ